jgi:gamma-glutamyltranspeptidase/glutathione hydrolase
MSSRSRSAGGSLPRVCLVAALGVLLGALRVSAAWHDPLAAADGMVVTESPPASWVGAEILRSGGNAIDAAIAVHFALAVTHPEAGNLGGGGFMLVRLSDGTTEALDFREAAPEAATRDLFLGPDRRPVPGLSTSTLLGTGVPGSVDGMAVFHGRI